MPPDFYTRSHESPGVTTRFCLLDQGTSTVSPPTRLYCFVIVYTAREAYVTHSSHCPKQTGRRVHDPQRECTLARPPGRARFEAARARPGAVDWECRQGMPGIRDLAQVSSTAGASAAWPAARLGCILAGSELGGAVGRRSGWRPSVRSWLWRWRGHVLAENPIRPTANLDRTCNVLNWRVLIVRRGLILHVFLSRLVYPTHTLRIVVVGTRCPPALPAFSIFYPSRLCPRFHSQ